jgi:hypothetical protein
VADIEADGGVLQESDTAAGVRHGAGAGVRGGHRVVQDRHAARGVLRQGEGRRRRHPAVGEVQLLRGRPGAGRRARRPRRPGDPRHRLPRRPEAQGHVRVAPGEGHRRRLAGHHRASLPVSRSHKAHSSRLTSQCKFMAVPPWNGHEVHEEV